MAGMASDSQLKELENSDSTDFDRLFLQLMISHHDGALKMVKDLKEYPGTAYDPILNEFISDLVNDQSVEITIKLFTDDLENVLKDSAGSDLRIDSESNRTIVDSLIFDYIKNNLSLLFDDKRRKISWVGKEFENDITWSYLEIKNIKNINGNSPHRPKSSVT